MKTGEMHVRISESDMKVWERFKRLVLEKYGKLHGVLGDEVIEALKMYLEHEEARRAHTQRKGRMVAKEGEEVRGMRAEDKEEDVKNGEKSGRRREGENEEACIYIARSGVENERESEGKRKREWLYIPNGRNRGLNTLRKIAEDVEPMVDVVYNGGEVHVNVFKRVIMKHAGIDKRTIKKYLDMLLCEYELKVDRRGFLRAV